MSRSSEDGTKRLTVKVTGAGKTNIGDLNIRCKFGKQDGSSEGKLARFTLDTRSKELQVPADATKFEIYVPNKHKSKVSSKGFSFTNNFGCSSYGSDDFYCVEFNYAGFDAEAATINIEVTAGVEADDNDEDLSKESGESRENDNESENQKSRLGNDNADKNSDEGSKQSESPFQKKKKKKRIIKVKKKSQKSANDDDDDNAKSSNDEDSTKPTNSEPSQKTNKSQSSNSKNSLTKNKKKQKARRVIYPSHVRFNFDLPDGEDWKIYPKKGNRALESGDQLDVSDKNGKEGTVSFRVQACHVEDDQCVYTEEVVKRFISFSDEVEKFDCEWQGTSLIFTLNLKSLPNADGDDDDTTVEVTMTAKTRYTVFAPKRPKFKNSTGEELTLSIFDAQKQSIVDVELEPDDAYYVDCAFCYLTFPSVIDGKFAMVENAQKMLPKGCWGLTGDNPDQCQVFISSEYFSSITEKSVFNLITKGSASSSDPNKVPPHPWQIRNPGAALFNSRNANLSVEYSDKQIEFDINPAYAQLMMLCSSTDDEDRVAISDKTVLLPKRSDDSEKNYFLLTMPEGDQFALWDRDKIRKLITAEGSKSVKNSQKSTSSILVQYDQEIPQECKISAKANSTLSSSYNKTFKFKNDLNFDLSISMSKGFDSSVELKANDVLILPPSTKMALYVKTSDGKKPENIALGGCGNDSEIYGRKNFVVIEISPEGMQGDTAYVYDAERSGESTVGGRSLLGDEVAIETSLESNLKDVAAQRIANKVLVKIGAPAKRFKTLHRLYSYFVDVGIIFNKDLGELINYYRANSDFEEAADSLAEKIDNYRETLDNLDNTIISVAGKCVFAANEPSCWLKSPKKMAMFIQEVYEVSSTKHAITQKTKNKVAEAKRNAKNIALDVISLGKRPTLHSVTNAFLDFVHYIKDNVIKAFIGVIQEIGGTIEFEEGWTEGHYLAYKTAFDHRRKLCNIKHRHIDPRNGFDFMFAKSVSLADLDSINQGRSGTIAITPDQAKKLLMGAVNRYTKDRKGAKGIRSLQRVKDVDKRTSSMFVCDESHPKGARNIKVVFRRISIMLDTIVKFSLIESTGGLVAVSKACQKAIVAIELVTRDLNAVIRTRNYSVDKRTALFMYIVVVTGPPKAVFGLNQKGAKAIEGQKIFLENDIVPRMKAHNKDRMFPQDIFASQNLSQVCLLLTGIRSVAERGEEFEINQEDSKSSRSEKKNAKLDNFYKSVFNAQKTANLEALNAPSAGTKIIWNNIKKYLEIVDEFIGAVKAYHSNGGIIPEYIVGLRHYFNFVLQTYGEEAIDFATPAPAQNNQMPGTSAQSTPPTTAQATAQNSQNNSVQVNSQAYSYSYDSQVERDEEYEEESTI